MTPADVDSAEIVISVRAPGRNPRRLNLGKGPIAIDLRRVLYGEEAR